MVLLAFAMAITQVASPDTWVHLSLGRWMSENGRVPRTNLLSFTEPDRPVVDHQWLFQAGLYGLWKVAGIDGATLAKAAIVAAAFGFILATARRKGAGMVTACLVTLLAAGAARFRFTLRPDVVGMLLLSVYLYVLERWRHGKTRGIFLLLPLQVAWANLHGSSVLGWGLTLAYAAAETLRALGARWRPGFTPAPRPRRELALLWAIALALVPLTLLNPFGARVIELPFGLSEAHAISGLKELHEERAHLLWSELGDRHVLFAVLAGVGFISLLNTARTRDLTELGLFVGFLEFAVRSGRFIGFFAIAVAPIVARDLWALLGARMGRWGEGIQTRPRRILLRVATAASLVGIAWLGVERSGEELPPGLGVAPGIFPNLEPLRLELFGSAIAGAAAEMLCGGRCEPDRVFNEFEHGGYIYWETRKPVFIDSRGLLAYDAKLMQDYVASWKSPERLKDLVDRYRIDFALVARPPLKASFEAIGWRRRNEGRFSIYVRVGPGAQPSP